MSGRRGVLKGASERTGCAGGGDASSHQYYLRLWGRISVVYMRWVARFTRRMKLSVSSLLVCAASSAGDFCFVVARLDVVRLRAGGQPLRLALRGLLDNPIALKPGHLRLTHSEELLEHVIIVFAEQGCMLRLNSARRHLPWRPDEIARSQLRVVYFDKGAASAQVGVMKEVFSVA